MKIYIENIWDELSKSNIIIDERLFSDCVSFQLQEIRKTAMEKILIAVPEYKQRNAALGLLSAQEEQQVKDAIQEIRTISNSLEQQILSVSWDGQESSRAAACDAVQNIRWP